MKLWLTPEEVKVDTRDKWNIPQVIRVHEYDIILKKTETIKVEGGKPFMNSIENITFEYEIVYLVNGKYKFIYVLKGFKDYILDTFKLRSGR